MTPKAQIIGLLPGLNPSDLAEVRTAVNALTAMGGTANTPRVLEDWLLAGLLQHLIGRGLIAEQGAGAAIARRDCYQQYKKKLPALMEYLAKVQEKAQIGKRHQRQFAGIVASSLAALLEKRNYFSVSAMISQIDKIPEALEDQFPGYIDAGIFGFVFQEVITGRRVMPHG